MLLSPFSTFISREGPGAPSLFELHRSEHPSTTVLNMAPQSPFNREALSVSVLDAFSSGGAETPKAGSKEPDECDVLSTSTPSTVSSISTALPSPELPGPASNFGIVKDGSIYRSSFPKIPNFEHMASLGLKTILTLIDTPYPLENQQHISDNGIMHVQLPLPAHKNTFCNIPVDSMERALNVLMDPKNHPVLVHCNKGKHRTGCVIGCYRKINGWSMEQILEEYRRYAGAKARGLDEKYVALFDQNAMIKAIEGRLPMAFEGKYAKGLSQSALTGGLGFPNRASTV